MKKNLAKKNSAVFVLSEEKFRALVKEEYIKYQNEPGTDKPTKRTTDPDPYGRKKGGTVSEPK